MIIIQQKHDIFLINLSFLRDEKSLINAKRSVHIIWSGHIPSTSDQLLKNRSLFSDRSLILGKVQLSHYNL